MSPSTTVRRAGAITAGALALTLGGAFTAGTVSALTLPLPTITCPVGQLLNVTTQKCYTPALPPVLPAPTKSSGSTSGGGITLPAIPKLPLPTGGSSGSSGGGLQLPGLSGAPGSSSIPSTGGATDATGTGSTVPGGGTATASNDPSSVPGATPGTAGDQGGMLSAASAFLPASGILGFADLGGAGGASFPTATNLAAIPSPLLAGQPAAALAAVQAPLLAVGEDAGKGGTTLAAFGGYALPGLLVILATAVVATVGAGNVRVWQARLAARHSA